MGRGVRPSLPGLAAPASREIPRHQAKQVMAVPLGAQPTHPFFFPGTCTHTPPRAPSHLCFALLSPLFSQGTGRARGVEGSPVVAMAPGIMGMFRTSWDSRLVESPGPVAMVFLLPPSRSISRASPPSLGAPQRAPFPPASPTWMRRQSACLRGAFNSYPASPVVVPLTSLPVLFPPPLGAPGVRGAQRDGHGLRDKWPCS